MAKASKAKEAKSPVDPAIADTICDAVATTPKGLSHILESLGNPIRSSTWYRWLQLDSALSERYAHARAAQAQVMADEITELADTKPDTVIGKNGPMLDRASIEWMRQRIDARKWVAAKLLPKVYGDNLKLTGDSDAPVELVIKHVGGE